MEKKMKDIIIKSKSYYPITTMIDGSTFKIPSKGKEVNITVSVVTDHLKELASSNLIQIIEK